MAHDCIPMGAGADCAVPVHADECPSGYVGYIRGAVDAALSLHFLPDCRMDLAGNWEER